MKFGLIGTGIIGEAMVKGFYNVGKFDDEMFISLRTAEKSAALAKQFTLVSICDDNQAIVDRCDVLIFAVLPEQAEPVLRALTIRDDQILLSVVSSITLGSLHQWGAPAGKTYRAIPLPPIEFGIGPIPICPPCPDLHFILDAVGTVVSLTNENQFLSIAVGSALMGMFYEMSASVAKFMHDGGLPADAAARYASSMMLSLSDSTSRAGYGELQEMAEDCLTPGGLNEQVLLGLRKDGWYDALEKQMEGIRTRLSKY